MEQSRKLRHLWFFFNKVRQEQRMLQFTLISNNFHVTEEFKGPQS